MSVLSMYLLKQQHDHIGVKNICADEKIRKHLFDNCKPETKDNLSVIIAVTFVISIIM